MRILWPAKVQKKCNVVRSLNTLNTPVLDHSRIIFITLQYKHIKAYNNKNCSIIIASQTSSVNKIINKLLTTEQPFAYGRW